MANPGQRVWIGIDEAGYGPNLGPLVMTAVVALGEGWQRPDVWGELAEAVDRAGGRPDRLWVDDSKRIFRSRDGLDRLRDGTLAALATAGLGAPADTQELMAALDPGDPTRGELVDWIEGDPGGIKAVRPAPRLGCARWSLVSVRSRVVGPARFNRLIAAEGTKAAAHSRVFLELLKAVWDARPEPGGEALGDKHGGRHRYREMLSAGWPDARVERTAEDRPRGRYRLLGPDWWLEIEFRPRADQDDGLVALASMVSKYARELWMAQFHRFWSARVANLKPTAGYPLDARRYRSEIEAAARELGLGWERWWRDR